MSKAKWVISNIVTGDTIPVTMFSTEGEYEERTRWHIYIPPVAKQTLEKYFNKQHYQDFTDPKSNAIFKLIKKGEIMAFVQLYHIKNSYSGEVFWAYGKELNNFEVARIKNDNTKPVRSSN